nr:uncharacterized protein LOC117280738 [Nicotiana tomentosiformis]
MNSQGLHLQQTVNDSSSPSLRYHIQCPTLLQSLAIPNPQNPSLCIALDFVPSNQPAVKLVSVHEDDQNQYSLGYEILALGIGSDQTSYCWRAIKVPPPNLLNSERDGRKRKSIEVLLRMGVAYCIWYHKFLVRAHKSIKLTTIAITPPLQLDHSGTCDSKCFLYFFSSRSSSTSIC